MVTLETALAIPVLLLVAMVAAWVPGVVGARIASADAAREAALVLARGGSEAQAAAIVASLLPGADVHAYREDALVRVQVVRQVPVGPWRLGSVSVRGQAAAVVEP